MPDMFNYVPETPEHVIDTTAEAVVWWGTFLHSIAEYHALVAQALDTVGWLVLCVPDNLRVLAVKRTGGCAAFCICHKDGAVLWPWGVLTYADVAVHTFIMAAREICALVPEDERETLFETGKKGPGILAIEEQHVVVISKHGDYDVLVAEPPGGW